MPLRVMTLRLTPPSAPASAPSPAVSTVTFSIAPSRWATVEKKLVPPLLNPFDALLMPSIVGLMVPPGIPLKCVLPPVGATLPGISRANAKVLRPFNGSVSMSFLVTVAEITFDVISSWVTDAAAKR